ncbi:DUF2061 domain-containing protein [Roseateles sp. DAIF2]|uniref:DUF2061 domain-containing protein n=1 Tax=Roseateles sp. DAIF2 TaxID=2714952 RepID=UPI0018A2C6CA|nr:DUF2061 domain-containing protein [Roseateles sp. DAIF2]QPF71562.1 DUF2061 domain-containing protein [Roseateles sp. DAIF2]
MSKTASFGVMHLGTAFGVTYLMTGSVAIAGAVTFVEPLVNTVLHYFHDRHWDRVEARLRGLFRRKAAAEPTAALNPA